MDTRPAVLIALGIGLAGGSVAVWRFDTTALNLLRAENARLRTLIARFDHDGDGKPGGSPKR